MAGSIPISDLVHFGLVMIAFIFPFLVAAFVIWLKWKKKKWKTWGATIFLILTIIYIGLSLNGRYVNGHYGGSEWHREWCPPLLLYELSDRYGSTVHFSEAGAALWPWILVDHWFWHPTDSEVAPYWFE